MKFIRTEGDISLIRESCQAAANILLRLCDSIAVGMTTYDIEQRARQLFNEFGVSSPCYNYGEPGNQFPSYICLSVNEEVVHGYGKMSRTLSEGDALTIDVAVEKNGFIGDNARTVIVGADRQEVADLLQATQDALDYAVKQARAGNRVGDISNAVERSIKRHGYGIVRDFVGHGVGETMHELPQIPNFGRRGSGALLKPGMCLAIEPMVTSGSHHVEILSDGWTAVTKDRKVSAHFEHTVLVTNADPEILTIPTI